eukprot:Plantae.Rhodophyta-Hildenbrandia_rubra.ctg14632.p1 GENE.Plantae.Rhodophyta-Hildenbrandia_rubra.ctg14632~~Plantae.Rhodophyta-Hildenbrandia_rubra.ctg14632.p1  ORF type:complete len:509 (+),score=60.41 Plantae.Rhodophyta-Hildenbrandia_rubra.ctg14632:350-1876(+)
MAVDTDDGPTTTPPPPSIAPWRLRVLASAMCGIQICYSVQINRGSAHLQLLGLAEDKVSLAWLAGPLSGLIMQPIVGIMSDSCTSPLGRRRPFLIFGTIFTSFSLLLFSNAKPLANMIVAPEARVTTAVAIAVVGFFALDFSIQAIQAPLRALVTDVASIEQQAMGNAYVALFTGVGNLIGSYLSSRKLSALLPIFETDVQVLFFLAAVLLCATVWCACFVVHEVPISRLGTSRTSTSEDALLRPAENGVTHHDENGWSAEESGSIPVEIGGGGVHHDSILSMLRNAPRPFWRVFIVQLFTWLGFFTLFVFVNTWVGRNVYLGRSSAPEGSKLRTNFEKGVRLGAVGNALTAFVTVLYSPIITSLLERFGVLKTYAFSQIVEAICLISSFFIRGRTGQKKPSNLLKVATLMDIGGFGIVWATTMGVPWALVGAALSRDYGHRTGLFTTIFNVSQSFPQLFVSFGAPFVLRLVDNDPSVVMMIGGFVALIGVVLIFVLRVDKFDEHDET